MSKVKIEPAPQSPRRPGPRALAAPSTGPPGGLHRTVDIGPNDPASSPRPSYPGGMDWKLTDIPSIPNGKLAWLVALLSLAAFALTCLAAF